MAPKPKNYDERVYHRAPKGMNRTLIGVLMILLLVAGSYLAVTKELPFRSHYEVKAVFDNSVNIRKGSPVRIAGVNVGEVKSTRRLGDAAEVTFTVEEEGRPVRTDSTARIRPRIFLEGNFFIDLSPGTPDAPELKDNGTIPVAQTSTAVQLDEILTSLQEPSRENLQAFLEGYGTGLNRKPTPAEDVDQDPSVKGKTAAEAINGSFKYGGDAGKGVAIVNQALLGTSPDDLSQTIASGNRAFSALVADETALKDLVTNFNTTAGAFADESENLGDAIEELGPTLEDAQPSLAKLNETFPPLRGFARDIRPGIAEIPATITAADPWLAQARPLLGSGELGFTADQLAGASPFLAAATNGSTSLFPQLQATSQCVSKVLIPTGDQQINDAFPSGVENYKEFFYAAVGLAGESQGFDGNGPYLRFQSGGGPVEAKSNNPNGGFENEQLYGNTIAPPMGSQPSLAYGKPPYNTSVPCDQQDPPDVNGAAATPGPASPAP